MHIDSLSESPYVTSASNTPEILIYIPSSLIHDYTGLNYAFQLNRYVTMDAEKLGNEMRYLNDGEGTNCQALGE
jgi:hypothetical protein